MKLEQTLNGGYAGLYGEVVTEDCYGLRKLNFSPDVIIDMGANVGVFSRFARELFPESKIISIEPDADNFSNLIKFTSQDNAIFINKAIGVGKIWRCLQDINGAHESYLSSGLGLPLVVGQLIPKIVETEIQTIMPDELISEYIKDGMKSIAKVDVEGGENAIFTHSPSMEALKKIDYIAMEIHWTALSGAQIEEVQQKTFESLASFIPTHNCRLINTMFYATKKI